MNGRNAIPIGNTTQALMMGRLIWAALVMSCVAIVIVLAIVSQPTTSATAAPRWLATWLPAGATLLAVFAGHTVRQQVFKAGWNGQAVSPRAYVMGTIGYLAPLQAAVVFTSIMMLVAPRSAFNLLVAGVGVAFMLFNFPTGSSMRPKSDDNRIGNFGS